MDSLVEAALIAWFLVGHTSLFVAIFNRLHAEPLSCRMVRWSERLTILAYLLLGGAVLAHHIYLRQSMLFSGGQIAALGASSIYAGACCLTSLVLAPRWLWFCLAPRNTPQPVQQQSRVVDLSREIEAPLAGDTRTRLAAALPGNQIFELEISERVLASPRLRARLDGLTVAHISDLHFTGHVTPPFFEYIVAEVNRWDADLVAITGDIIESPDCLPWIPNVLGRLRARYGVYFVLGNHDTRMPDVPLVRRTLEEAGLIDLGGRRVELRLKGTTMLIAGNEQPWFTHLPDVDENPPDEAAPFRMLLAHTPDALPWARQHHFDLMLAGHTHGGQIRIPGVGPIVTPSRYGVKYADGVHWESPTLMHVSRGVSGLHQLRWNCRPEITKLVLTRELQEEEAADAELSAVLSVAPVR